MNNESVDVVRKLGQAWNEHDLDTVYGLLHEDYREHWNGKLVKRGRDATRAADQAIYDAVPDYRREVDQLFGEGESVASLWRFLGTGPAGPLDLPIACFYKVRDGLIVECWIHVDSGDMARALGMSAHEETP